MTTLACNAAQPAPAAAPDTRQADEAAVRKTIGAWLAAATAKDPATFVSFYADDATLMLEDAPDATGKAEIQPLITGMMQDPNFSLAFEPAAVEVARAGDLAYESGTYSITMSDPATKQAATEKGHYLVLWRKGPDGSWKVVRDVPVSDPSTPAAK
jgi:uncharacterized protein (TIGR02246 family)